MKTAKKMISLLLCALMVFSLFSVSVAAEDELICYVDGCGGTCEWRIDSAYGCTLTNGLYCTKCDTRQYGETVYNHDYHEYARIEATCLEKGKIFYSCERTGCYETKIEEIPVVPDAHSLSEWTVTKEATCNETGSRYRVCNNSYTDEEGNVVACTYKEVEEIPFDDNAHVYDGEWHRTKDPTCTEEGLEYTTCTVCNKAKTTRAVPMHSDTWYEYDRKAPSCSSEGTAYVVCKKCNYNSTVVLPVDPEAHIWFQTETKAASCSEEGYIEYVCRWHRDATKKDVLEKTAHESKGTWEVVTAPTCMEEGKEAILCKNCTYEFDSRAVAKIPHLESAWLITSGNCEEGGTAHKICTYPHYDEEGDSIVYVISTRTFSAGTHINRCIQKVEATCTQDGYTVDWCPECQTEFAERKVIEKHHTLGEWKVYKEAFCDEVGEMRRNCTKCDYFESKEIPKKHHMFLITSEALPATCLLPGVTEGYFCTECLQNFAPQPIPATGHCDADNDGCCDNCYTYFVDTEEGVVNCSCFCHNEDGISKILFKIFNFLYQLLGVKQSCECGKLHYEKGLFG